MARWSGFREALQLHRQSAPAPAGRDVKAVEARRSTTGAAAHWRWTTISPDPRPAEDREPSAVVIRASRAGEGLPANPPPAA